jgi:mannan endo-1,4-beta-mannosidase
VKIRVILILLFVVVFGFTAIAQAAINVNFNIDTSAGRGEISPYIYGSNFSLGEEENLASRRSGGNRLTGYNWENNFSNAGSDWHHYNDNYLVAGLLAWQQKIPGIFLTNFQDSCLAAGEYSLVTLQMAGYVSADGNREVFVEQKAPSSRWKEVVYAKPGPFCEPPGGPNLTDGYVYMDECVNFLVNRYGNASTPNSVKAYALDNEPALWPSTHPRIHPSKTGCVELINRSVALASAVKNVDPTASIFGPVLYGFGAFYDFQGAPDWSSVI